LAWFGIGLYSHNLADEYKKQVKNNWKLFLIASLTVGLAPFSLPYILGKI
jgi:hypothetical protein